MDEVLELAEEINRIFSSEKTVAEKLAALDDLVNVNKDVAKEAVIEHHINGKYSEFTGFVDEMSEKADEQGMSFTQYLKEVREDG